MAVTYQEEYDRQKQQHLIAQQNQQAQQQAWQQAQQSAAQKSAQNLKTQQQAASIGTAQKPVTGNGTVKQNTPEQTAYTPSDAVVRAQQQLEQIQAAKPQGYNSKYGAALDNILGQIQNPEKFKYDFNGDEMFKQYADLYTQKGRQASMDAMGQAAALTGGYGNSYAQQVGNQAYDQYLMDLYAKGDQLRQEAYQRYQDDRADRYNQLNALGQADERDYGRYRDTVSDWERDRGYYTDLYNNERNFDYGTYQDQRDYDERVRQFNESLDWDKMSQQQKYAAEYAMQILANGGTPSDELLAQAGLSAEDAQKIMAQPVVAAGGGGDGGSKGTVYEDKNGVFYSYDNKGNPQLVNQADALSGKYNIDITQNNKTYGTQALFNTASANVGTIAANLQKNNKKKNGD